MEGLSVVEWIVIAVLIIVIIFPFIMHKRQTEVVLKNEFGDEKKLNIGYSWSMLVFGAFVPLLRKDWTVGIVLLPFTIIHFFTNSILGMVCSIIIIVYAFLYNKQYFHRMKHQGFSNFDENLKQKLQDKNYI
jgi:hypothetical protein